MQHQTSLASSVKAMVRQCRVQSDVLVQCVQNSGEGVSYVYKGGSQDEFRSESDALGNAINKVLQSFGLVFSLGYVVFDRDRFRQSGKSCSAIS